MKTISTDHGRISVAAHGATLVSWQIPYRGGWRELLLVPSDVKQNPDYLGAFIGPYAGRIDSTDGVLLHGGKDGYSHRQWQLTVGEDVITAELAEESVRVSYRLVLGGLDIRIQAAPDTPTPLNLTSHPYFQLAESVSELWLWIPADSIVETDLGLGRGWMAVPPELDFRQPRLIGESQIDHCFWTDRLSVWSQEIRLVLTTSYPSVVVYTYDQATEWPKRSGLAIEAQRPINSLAYHPAEPEYHLDRPLEACLKWRWRSQYGDDQRHSP